MRDIHVYNLFFCTNIYFKVRGNSIKITMGCWGAIIFFVSPISIKMIKKDIISHLNEFPYLFFS